MATRKPVDQNDQNPVPTQTQTAMPEYLKSALRLSTSYPLGAAKVDNDIVADEAGTAGDTSAVAGIFVLDYIPTLGVASQASDPINRALFNEFRKIRAKISGNRPYAPVDHMIYRMAIDSLRDYYNYAARIYKVLATYNATNLYKPKHILSAMGLVADDWIDNAAELYQWLRTHQDALLPFPTVPLGSMTGRHNTYNTYFFTDGDLARSQTYIMNQRCFWSYEEVDEVKGLTPKSFPSRFTAFRERWDDMYTALQMSTDVYIIAADISRAFEESVVNKLECPAVDAAVEYLKLDAAMFAIMNATSIPFDGNERDPSLPDSAFLKAFRVEDRNNVLVCTPSIEATRAIGYGGLSVAPANLSHLNFIQAEPDENTIATATRLRVNVTPPLVPNDETRNYYAVDVESMGTEVVIGFTMDVIEDGFPSELEEVRIGSLVRTYVDAQQLQSSRELVKVLGLLSQFDWHPPVVVVVDHADQRALSTIEDIQNYVPISHKQLSMIHEATLLAEFGIPN